MVGYYSKSKFTLDNSIELDNLDKNISIIETIDNDYCKYVCELYYEYKDFLHSCSVDDIKEELLSGINSISDIGNNTKMVDKCSVIISPSHEDTYHVIKQLQERCRDNNTMVICFDMHCDAYDYNDNLWKGNMFSKLLNEKFISSFIVYGVPKNRICSTSEDIPKDIQDRVYICKRFNINKILKLYKPSRVFISIDIDCLDTRKSKYSSVDYCPTTILSLVSRLNIINSTKEQMIELVKGCIYIKNDLGYSNLYKIGENKLNITKLLRYIQKTKKICYKKGIELGYNNGQIYSDITEVVGYDYGRKTYDIISKLIDELEMEVKL